MYADYARRDALVRRFAEALGADLEHVGRGLGGEDLLQARAHFRSAPGVVQAPFRERLGEPGGGDGVDLVHLEQLLVMGSSIRIEKR